MHRQPTCASWGQAQDTYRGSPPGDSFRKWILCFGGGVHRVVDVCDHLFDALVALGIKVPGSAALRVGRSTALGLDRSLEQRGNEVALRLSRRATTCPPWRRTLWLRCAL